MPAFPSTRHSVIERLRVGGAEDRREALGDLVHGYWKPVYKYLRIRWGLAAEEAEDTTQAFFAESLEHAWLNRYDPDQARFRTFVRLCVDRLVMNARQAAGRAKRGGGAQMLSLDYAAAEHELLAHASVTQPADDLFRREFVRALLDRAIRSLRDECLSRGREQHWRLFERYDLAAESPVSYADLAAEFQLTPGQVTGLLAQARRAFRTHTVAELRALCATAEEFRREARELLGLEVE